MKIFLLSLCFISSFIVCSQTTDSIKGKKLPLTIYAEETFKSSRVCIGQSVENPANGALVFLISHHFGALNTGSYEFFGLDQASTRIGLEYGIVRWLAVGAGRSTYNKTFDGYLKVRLLRQSKGKRQMPLSISVFGNMAVNTLKLSDPNQKDYFDARLSYCTELILARKFGNVFSWQISPEWIHKNLVATHKDFNNLFSIGTGISFRLSDVVSLNGEYHYLLPNQHLTGIENSVTLSCDIKVGLHVFQLFLTNSQGNFEQAFITETNGKWYNGDIYFGFNIHRVFPLKNPKNL
jgi:opacity protein-like surface antigen